MAHERHQYHQLRLSEPGNGRSRLEDCRRARSQRRWPVGSPAATHFRLECRISDEWHPRDTLSLFESPLDQLVLEDRGSAIAPEGTEARTEGNKGTKIFGRISIRLTSA